MESERKIKFRYLSIVALVVGMLLTVYSLPLQFEPGPEREGQWNTVFSWPPALGAFANLTTGEGGIQAVFIVNNSVTTYPDNQSTDVQNMSWSTTDEFDLSIPHSTNFDIVVRARFNVTQAYEVGNATWVTAWTKCEITSTNSGGNLNIGANTAMSKTQITTTDDYMWVNFYIQTNDTAENLQISRGDRVWIDHINLSAYY